MLIGMSEFWRPTPNIQIWAERELCGHARVGVQNGGSARVIPDRRCHLQQRDPDWWTRCRLTDLDSVLGEVPVSAVSNRMVGTGWDRA